jgi:hypothetical protein
VKPAPDGQGVVVVLTFSVVSGWEYTVEFRNDLDAGFDWQALPGAPHSAGTVTDISLGNQRYYRLRID